MNLSVENVDTKKSLRIIWIVEGALFFVMSFAVLLIWPDRVASLIELAPYLFGLIALQATGAIGGSSLKRWTESLKLKAGGNGDVVSDPGIAAGDRDRGVGNIGTAQGGTAGQRGRGRRRQASTANHENGGGVSQ